MTQTAKADHIQSKTDHEKPRRVWPWFVVGGVLVVCGLVVASCYLKDGAERAKFLTEAIFSALVLTVIIIQAMIYSQQRKIMQEQKTMAAIGERAYLGLKDFEINPVHRFR